MKILNKTTAEMKADFDETLDAIKNNHKIDIRKHWLFSVGPDECEVIMKQFFAFYERGYNQAKIDFLNEGAP